MKYQDQAYWFNQIKELAKRYDPKMELRGEDIHFTIGAYKFILENFNSKFVLKHETVVESIKVFINFNDLRDYLKEIEQKWLKSSGSK